MPGQRSCGEMNDILSLDFLMEFIFKQYMIFDYETNFQKCYNGINHDYFILL